MSQDTDNTLESNEILIPTADAPLPGMMFLPKLEPKAAIVINSAVGVPQRYYRHFAAWLAAQGFVCLTYDYRDFNIVDTGPLKNSNATLASWGVEDQAAAQVTISGLFPDAPLWVIGHSFGGFMAPFQPQAQQIDRLITVASGPVHISDHPLPYRFLAAFFWYGPPMWLTSLMGYHPAKMLRLGPNLPSGVYWQWRKWCTSRGFYSNDIGGDLPEMQQPGYAGPMKVIAVEDDEMVPPAAVWRLMQLYPEAKKRQLLLKPQDFGLKKIGHIGMFNRANAALWPHIIA